jgi:hypothetical protein
VRAVHGRRASKPTGSELRKRGQRRIRVQITLRPVDEPLQQLLQRDLPVVDGGTFVVGERDVGEHALQVVFASSSWPLLEFLGV